MKPLRIPQVEAKSKIGFTLGKTTKEMEFHACYLVSEYFVG